MAAIMSFIAPMGRSYMIAAMGRSYYSSESGPMLYRKPTPKTQTS
jgi:hypothetical protein